MQLVDLGVEREVLDDVAGRLGESGQVRTRLAGHVGGVVQHPGQVQRGGVVELVARSGLEQRRDGQSSMSGPTIHSSVSIAVPLSRSSDTAMSSLSLVPLTESSDSSVTSQPSAFRRFA